MKTSCAWGLALVLLVTLGLSAVNIALYQGTVALELEVTQRQQLINEGVQLTRFNTQFVQTLANVAARTNDTDLALLLARHGITYTVQSPAQAADTTEVADDD
jgi:hypothetical protein